MQVNTVEIKTPRSTHQVLEEKLTSLGLYVTALEAYEMWQTFDPSGSMSPTFALLNNMS